MIDAKTIATNAARQKKPSKAKALDALKAVIDAGTLEGSEHHLAALYAFFMPTGPNIKTAAKDNFAWVALAAAKNDVRDYLNYVYVNEEHITATDGHRMHRAPNLDGLAPGFYHPNGEKAGEPDWQLFPDVDRIVPSEDTHGQRSFSPEGLPVVEVSDKGITYAYEHDANPTRRINKVYVDVALAGAELPVAAVMPKDVGSAVLFRHGDREAVVMPLRT